MATGPPPPADLTAIPAVDQHICHNGKDYTTIKEGLAYILVPAEAAKVPQQTPKGETQPQSVFYNPIQQFNRDLSVLAIKAYGEHLLQQRKEREQLAHSRHQKNQQKKREKKRKREEDAVTADSSRKKAEMLDGASEIISQTGAEAAREVPIESESDAQGILPVVAPRPTGALAAQDTPADVVTGPVLMAPKGVAKAPKEPHTEQDAPAEAAQEFPMESELDARERFPVTAPQSVGVLAAHDTPAVGGVTKPVSTAPKSDAKAPKEPPTPTFKILDALSATGLRALRYAQEIPFATSITANDLLEEATKAIQLNVTHNRLEDKIKSVTGNALTHMYSFVGNNFKDAKGEHQWTPKYDVIDLDPYGTAAPFLDAAVQAVCEDGGLLCVTCTDAGVWASNSYPEKAYSLYGGVTTKGQHSHEGGLRLILHAIATSGARYGMAIEPLLSLSIDFYARVFVRVYKSAADVKFLCGRTMLVYNCDQGCGAWSTQTIGRNKVAETKEKGSFFWKHTYAQGPSSPEHCEHCGAKTHIGGPMWAGPLHSPEFIQKILDDLPHVSKDTYQTTARIEGMLTLALEESIPPVEDLDSPTSTTKTGKYDPATLDPAPFLFIPSALAKVIHCVTPVEAAFRGALRHLGYRVTRSHTKPGSIKTDAPWDVVWEVMREWARQRAPVREGAIREGTAGWKVMGLDRKKKGTEPENKGGNAASEPKATLQIEVVFDEKLGRDITEKKIVRFQQNPRDNWGPMSRAKGKA